MLSSPGFCRIANILSSSKCIKRFYRYKTQLMKLRSPVSQSKLKILKKLQSFNNGHMLTQIPERFLRIKRVPADYKFVVNIDTAEKIANLIKDDILKDDSTIIEGNPGVGFLTKKLLEVGVPKIQVFESSSSSLHQLQTLLEKNPHRLEVVPGNIFQIYKYFYLDKMDNGNRIATLLKDIKTRKWTESPALKIIGCISDINLIRHITMSCMEGSGITSFGRIECYFILPPVLYFRITSEKVGFWGNRARLIMCGALFDITLIDKVPKTDFLPWEVSSKKKISEIDVDYLYVVKIALKPDLFERFDTEDKLKHFYYFVRYFATGKHNKIIPMLEKWIPGCGPLFISKGLTIYTNIQDLTTDELINVFEDFFSLPQLTKSDFIHVMETTFLHRSQANIDDDLDKDILEMNKLNLDTR